MVATLGGSDLQRDETLAARLIQSFEERGQLALLHGWLAARAAEQVDGVDLGPIREALPLVEIVTSADGGGGLDHGHGWSFRVGARACEVLARIPDRVCVIARPSTCILFCEVL